MENLNLCVRRRIQLAVLTFFFLLFATGLNARPALYSYLYHGAIITLTPKGNKFVAKFADEKAMGEALERLEGLGLRVSTDLPTLTGDMAFVVESSTDNLQGLQILKETKEVLFASPVFQEINGKETATLNTFIVKFKDGASESEIARLNALHGVSIEREDKNSLGGKRMLLRHAWRSSEDVFALSYIYSLSVIVKYATPDFVVFSAFDAEDPAPDDPYYQYQWNLMKVDAEQAWMISKGISSITIAVVDDGVDLEHDDLDGKLVGGYDAYDDDSDPSPGGSGADDSHGTACAGIIGAKTDNNLGIAGLAQNCKVMPIRAGNGSSIYLWAAAAGINWAVAHGADVISNSYSGGNSNEDLEAAINYAVTSGRGGNGCVVLFSSGNNSGSVLYPGSLSNVIAVGATDADDEIWDYSCTGSALDVVAPSGDILLDGDIWTTDLSGSAGVSSTDYMSVFGGTSAACPLVAGLAGLILSKDSYLTNIQVQTILQHTAKDLGSSGRDDNYGWGRIDAWAALRETYSGVLPGNEVWRGTVTVSGNVTVPSGVTLLVFPGTTISFAGNYKLRVEGKLLAVGSGAEQPSNPVTFTRSGGQWYGIEFYNGNNSSAIQYAVIENAQYGIYNYNTDVAVSNSVIQNNSTGVYVTGYPMGISWNKIEDNYYGVRCNTYGDANIQVSNVLRYNGSAVYGDATSVPSLGSSIGYNSLYYNDYFDVYSSYSGAISANGNWWGSYPAYPSIYGNVDYSNELSFDPNNWAGSMTRPVRMATKSVRQPASPVTEILEGDTTGIGALNAAYGILRNNDSLGAFTAFRNLLERHPDRFVGSRALVTAFNLADRLQLNRRQLLDDAISRHPGTRLLGTAKLLLVGLFLKQDATSQAMNLATSLIEDPDSTIAKHALYNVGNIAWYRLNNETLAEYYFQRLITLFPGDPLSESALATMVGQTTPGSGQNRIATEPKAKSFTVSESSPNPFNPSTQINYELPEGAQVSIIIYDVLGRRVAQLVNGYQEAGSQTAIWNAHNVASGVYLARFTATDGNGILKLSRTMKLVLTK